MAGTEERANPDPCGSIRRRLAEPFDDDGADPDGGLGATPGQLGKVGGLPRLTRPGAHVPVHQRLRLQRRQPHGVREGQSGIANGVRDQQRHRRDRPGQIRGANQHDLAVLGQFGLHAAAQVAPRRHSRQLDGVRDQDAASQAFGSQHAAQRCRRKVMAVGNEAGPEPVVAELVPDVVVEAGQHGIRAIA